MSRILYIFFLLSVFLMAELNVDKVSDILSDIKSEKDGNSIKFFSYNPNLHLKKK